MAQIAANEERHRREQAEYLLEGERTRKKLQAEKDFIEVSSAQLATQCLTVLHASICCGMM